MAAWKPKEKPLTPEEAVEHARKELAPFWLSSAPLLAGIKGADGKCTVHPLDKSFDKGAWLLLFVDLTDFAGAGALQYAHEWRRRYASFDVHLLAVVRPAFSFLSSAGKLSALLGRGEGFATVLDHDGSISAAFGVDAQNLPTAKLLHQRKPLFTHKGDGWARQTEVEIQKFLRIKDPGLSLAPPFQLLNEVPADATSLAELGSRAPSPMFTFSGQVTREADRVVIKDPQATIRFKSPHPRVSIVAQGVGELRDPTRVRVELNGEAVFEAAAAADLTSGDEGGSQINVSDARLYHVLQALPGKTREVTLRFPDADRIAVAIYAARFVK